MKFDLQREMRIRGRGTDIAKELGVSRSYVSAIYTGKKQPTDDFLRFLGWERVVTETFRRVKK